MAKSGGQGKEWWPHSAKWHFLSIRRHWLLRKKPIVPGKTPADLSVFVLVITVVVLT